MTRSSKKELISIIIGVLALAAALLITELVGDIPTLARIIIFLIPYLILGVNVIIDAVRGMFNGELMDENFLMSAASIGAICLGEYTEAVLVMLLYSIGEFLQSLAVGKSRNSISALMDIRPDSANIERDGEIITVAPEDVSIGEIILVRAGDRIPLDGTVIDGASGINTSALTGESLPRDVTVGDEVLSGCINLNGTLRIRVERKAEDSTASRILELIEGAAANKSPSEEFITKFAKWYTPSVVGFAFLLAVIPPLFFFGSWNTWIYRALTFLVISCPCALVISVPLTFFSGIGCSSKRGILIKGSNYLESLSKCGTVVFDKTGTLTKGKFAIKKLNPVDVTDDELLRYAAACEQFSTHPLALSIINTYGDKPIPQSEQNEELAGRGVCATVEGHKICCGNINLMREIGIIVDEPDEAGTVIHVARDGKYIGFILIADETKSNVKTTVELLEQGQNVHTVMLTGDRRRIGEATAEELGISEFHAELLPQDKVSCLESLMSSNTDNKRTTVFIGDGINDAPVLARADVGIAMGCLGSDAAIEAADVVIMDDNLEKIPMAIAISKQTVKIAWQNIAFALAVKLIVLVLGAFGFAEMWLALFADVGVCLLAVLNSMRAMGIGKDKRIS